MPKTIENKIANLNTNAKIVVIVSVLFSLIRNSAGLDCYSCMYERIITQTNSTSPKITETNGNLRCKDFSAGFTTGHIFYSHPGLIPCDNETDAMNYQETEELKEKAQFTYPLIPAEFRMTCAKLGVQKTVEHPSYYEIELVIRGCYAKRLPPPPQPDFDFYLNLDLEEENVTTTPPPPPPPLPPMECGFPSGTIWAGVRDGSLFNNTQINSTTPTLSACLCDTGDRCNSVGRLGLGGMLQFFSALILILQISLQ